MLTTGVTCTRAGSVWAAVADSAEGHRVMLLIMYVLSTASRSAIALTHGFWPLLAAIVATEALSSPVSIIADTVIAAACAEVSLRPARVVPHPLDSWGLVP